MRHQGSVVVIGQGYVGLPLAMRAVEVGYSVVGIDADHARIRALLGGDSFVEDVPERVLRDALASGRYLPAADYDAAEAFEIAVITVPTPLKDSLPDLSYIESAATSISRHLSRGATVILESTTYPGTTEELLVPILEQGSGLQAGRDFCVGYSPERIDPGNPAWGLVNTPKIVSGIDHASLQAVDDFYSSIVDRTVRVSSPKEAELAKLLENTFRHVNIALVNELAMFAHQLGVDIWETIEAASTKPFGFMKFTPGPGVGGHCLPIDPSYLSWQVRRTVGRTFRFVELANDVNDHMPDYVVQRVIEMLNDRGQAVRGSAILVAGIAYKRNSGDSRQSPAIRIIELLDSLGATVSVTDPHISAERWPSHTRRAELTLEEAEASDLIVLLTDHAVFDGPVLTNTSTPIFDTRAALTGDHARL